MKSHGEMLRLWDGILSISDGNPRKVLQRNQDWSIITMTVLASSRAISNSTIRINYSPSLKIQNPQNQPLQPDEQMVLLITEKWQAYQDHSGLLESKANVARWCARQPYAIAQPYRRQRVTCKSTTLAFSWPEAGVSSSPATLEDEAPEK